MIERVTDGFGVVDVWWFEFFYIPLTLALSPWGRGDSLCVFIF